MKALGKEPPYSEKSINWRSGLPPIAEHWRQALIEAADELEKAIKIGGKVCNCDEEYCRCNLIEALGKCSEIVRLIRISAGVSEKG